MITIVAAAFAQDQATGFSAQNYRPPIDARTSLWTERTTSYEDPALLAELVGSYTSDPLLYRFENDTEEVLVSDLWQADLAAGFHFSRLRLGLVVPLYLSADGLAVETGTGIGDLAADLKINVLRDGRAPLGLAASGRLIVPTATVRAPLGNANTGWEAMLLVDKQFSRIVLAANGGVRGAPAVSLDNIELDDQAFYRGAVSYLFDGTSRAGVSADVAGQLNLKDLSNAGAPLEAMVGAWACLGNRVTLRGGVGRGFNDGIGSANIRALLGLGWAPGAACARKVVDSTPQLVVIAQNPSGQPVPNVSSTLDVSGEPRSGGTELTAELEPGTYTYTATATGYQPLTTDVTMPTDVDVHRVVVTMLAAPQPVTVRLTDTSGNPLTGEWSSDYTDWAPVATETTTTLPVGMHMLYGRAPGYIDGEERLVVKMDTNNVATIELGIEAVEKIETIDLKEVVQFDTNSATIKPISYDMLNEVGTIMNRHPEILKIRIEGHTDSVGDAAYNMSLSQRRAASVVGYLQGRGVELDRMSSEGYGEERPIASNETPEGRYQNRRVSIAIEARAED